MALFTMSLLKPSLILSSIRGKPQYINSKSCAPVVRRITSRSTDIGIIGPRAMERMNGSVVLRRDTNASNNRKGEGMPGEGLRLVSCARLGGAPATEDRNSCRGSDERRDPASEDMDGGGGGGDESRLLASTPRLLTLPTILTLGRVAAVPLLVSTFYMNGWWATTATTSIFIAAAITDWLDGYIARKMRLSTAFGAFLDPVADKLMVAATLVLLCTRPFEVAVLGQVPWLLPIPAIAIIGREITMSAVREWAASQNSKVLEAVAVNNLGKWKTATQMTALTILLATRDSSLSGPGILPASGVVLLYISAGLAVWSLAVYMRKIWRILLK
ncbi:CDP-diacylglycerol--glycerol-3-phosphate 3-phosphatidyltransferase 2-like [Magnolia sinica]|uniref:CDP-diacylglycerol--glycerol-3-phosphate 3-phosphatidyltransferase 2-like n=1 Tax=Magnolia sinica TaxID=86752 RepID=UPI002658FAF5|nr:CDP-diacylglycerol--glycerol-3-phosphate 3-phosphatidyltransferase 2-like [Magnolia sinica]